MTNYQKAKNVVRGLLNQPPAGLTVEEAAARRIADFLDANEVDALKRCAARCETQRQKILADTTDPSRTEHLAECSGDFLAAADAVMASGKDRWITLPTTT